MDRSDERIFFDSAARKIIHDSLSMEETADEEMSQRGRLSSLRLRLVTEVVTAASKHAWSTGQHVENFRHIAFQGLAIVDGLQYGLTDIAYLGERTRSATSNWNFWQHDDQPYARIKTLNLPYMNRDSIEEDAYKYLELPYRVPLLERTIVDILIALELFAYSKEMLEKPIPGFRWATKSPLMQRHVLREYLGGRVFSVIILLGPAYLIAAYGPKFIGNSATPWVAGILVCLFILELLATTFFLPFAWRIQRKSRRRAKNLLISMLNTYAELNGHGQISTRRLRDVASRAADSGVVWPTPLFPILDDNISRTGKL